MQFQDITGQRFNSWMVISRRENDTNHNTLWLCRCICGSLSEVSQSNLQSGLSSQCLNCKYSKKVLSDKDAIIRRVFSTYKTNAKSRDYEFELTLEEFSLLICSACFYCGANPTPRKCRRANRSFPVNGLDRFDNALGYTLPNSRPCCTTCNLAKKTLLGSEFIAHCKTIAANHF